jgi:undecaprenyl-diphosphatase
MARKVLFVVVAYVALALVVVGWGWLLTHSLQSSIEGTDDDVSRWFAGQRTSWLDPVAGFGTLLGETAVGSAVCAVVAMIAGLVLRSLRAALLVVLALAGDGGIYWLGSQADPRDRPPVHILDQGLVPTHSFPSGHTGTAVAVYGGAALLLASWLRTRDRGTGLGRAVVVVLACVPLFVALSRLYQGAHHLTDVGTSLAYGTVWLAVVAATVQPRDTRVEPPVTRSHGGVRDPLVPHRGP